MEYSSTRPVGVLKPGCPSGAKLTRFVLLIREGLNLLVNDLFAKLLEGLLVVEAVVVEELVVVGELVVVDGHAALANLVHDLAVALAFSNGDRLVDGARHDGRRSVMRIDDRVVLDSGRQRKEQLAARLDRRGHPHVDAEAPLEVLHHRIVPTLRLSRARAGEEVRVLETTHLERVILGIVARLEGIEDHVALGCKDKADVSRILFDAQNLALQLRTEVLPTETKLETVVNIADKLAARNVDVAGDSFERKDAMACLDAVRLLVDSKAPMRSGQDSRSRTRAPLRG